MKYSLSEKLKYQFDRLMAKGVVSLVAMIVLVSFIGLAVFSVAIRFISIKLGIPDVFERPVWTVAMHILSAGTIGKSTSTNVIYLGFLFMITFFGLIMNNILIGIIATKIREKLGSLKRGNSKVIEKNHTVIFGFNEAISIFVNQLIIANENQKRGCIIVASDIDSIQMETVIDEFVTSKKTTELIYRCGNTMDNYMMDLCSILKAKSIIINYDDDFKTIKQMIAIKKYLLKNKPENKDFHIVVMIMNSENMEVAKNVLKYINEDENAEIAKFFSVIHFEEIIIRLIAHSCRYPGVSKIFSELLSFEGNEIYYEPFEQLDGMKFSDILYLFDDSCPIGIAKNENNRLKIHINPDKDMIYDYKSGDKLIHIAEDDETSVPCLRRSPIDVDYVINRNYVKSSKPVKKMLVLGYNKMLRSILEEFDKFVGKESFVLVLTNENQEVEWGANGKLFENISVKHEKNFETISKFSVLKNIISKDFDTLLLLSDSSINPELADFKILKSLVNIRNILAQENRKINIITQMNLFSTQKIADTNVVSDFVVGTNISNLIMSQYSENKELKPLYQELLDNRGNEIYIKRIEKYVDVEKETDFFQLMKIAYRYNEIAVGYKKDGNVIVNPKNKRSKIKFDKNDFLIVISEEHL